MKRRNFVTWFGLGGIVSFFTTAIAACSNGTEVSQSATSVVGETATTLQSGKFVKIGTVQTLKQNGRILFKDANNSALVLSDPSNPGRAFAVKAVCTHKGCAVDWSADESKILCPCHGSTFKPDGTAIKGPATKPLERYEAKIEGDAVFVKVS
jgi:cytochrome b6-f complex iron-sulfur subunit